MVQVPLASPRSHRRCPRGTGVRPAPGPGARSFPILARSAPRHQSLVPDGAATTGVDKLHEHVSIRDDVHAMVPCHDAT